MMNKKNLFPYFFDGSSHNWQDWRWQLQNRVTSLTTLNRILGRPVRQGENLRRVLASYPMAITPHYLSLIGPDDNDPLALQCIPSWDEVAVSANYAADPLDEDSYMPAPKMIRRYPDRIVAMVTKNCAMYCRHCNRKRFWKSPEAPPLKSRLDKMVRYVAQTPQIREVILSGGDPLIYDDARLEMILSSFASIPHVKVLRMGSRTPAVLPMRITQDLCRILKRYRPLWFNTQFNHPSEITGDAVRACNMIQDAGIPVSNQSVLLKGVNDSPDIMQRLLHQLQEISVRPYYLFHCEPVQGCGHFRTDIQAGVEMMETLRRRCSGLALPQYVADLPGQAGKAPLLALSPSIKNDLRKHQDFFDNFE